jgi:molecular chaperone GrpE
MGKTKIGKKSKFAIARGSKTDKVASLDESDDKIEAVATVEEADGEATELESLRNERDEFRDLLQRKQAEFENYRRRVDKEKESLRDTARAELLEDLLVVIDACEKGLDSMRSESTDAVSRAFLDGYEMLLKQLNSLLEKHDVKEIPGVGATFDPNIHEAVVRETSKDHEEGQILEQYRKGYLIKDRLLRPSQVRVAVLPDD